MVDCSRKSIERLKTASPWARLGCSIWPWLLPAALSLYIKYHMLTDVLHGGFRIVARALGRTPSAANSTLTLLERLSFFRADLLVAFLIVPFGLVLLVLSLPKRYRLPVVGSLSLALSLVLFLQFRAFDEEGQFLSYKMFRAAFTWGVQNPSVGFHYLHLRAVLAACACAAAAFAAWWGLRKWRPVLQTESTVLQRFPSEGWLSRATSAVVFCLALITIAAWAAPLPRTPFHESVVLGVLRSLSDHRDVDIEEYRNLSVDEIEKHYRSMVWAPADDKSQPYWAKARGYNVIFLVLETAPAKILPANGDLADFPNLQRLRENSFVGTAHYTTYPETHQAQFSILSSWYPSSFVDVNGQHPDLVASGAIMHKLSAIGYDTAVYSPYDFVGEPDADMFHSTGFERQVYPKNEHPIVLKVFQSSVDFRMSLDTGALRLLKQDMERDLEQQRPFAYMYAPQISHGPWLGLDLKGRGGPDAARQGRALLEIPDEFLGEIMQVLERHNQLEHTVIVVVGDHGVRSRQEDPNFTGNIFGDYSFHVPLVIYAPGVLNHRVIIPWVTSHIDIAPTVLALLGVGQSFEQGTPIWNPHLADRTTYFFARSLCGSDGYYSRGAFFMWSHVTDTVYANKKMSFDTTNVVPGNSAIYGEVASSIRRIAGLEEVWTTRFSQDDSVRNHLYDSSLREPAASAQR